MIYEHIKCVFITGGTSGIGLALAEKFLNDNKKVIICGRRKEILDDLKNKYNKLIVYQLDIGNLDDIKNVIPEIIKNNEDINCIINNAGIQKTINFNKDEIIDENIWNEEININIKGFIYICSIFIPYFKDKKYSSIINVSSGLALSPAAIYPIYCATKAFIHSFTRSLRWQLRDSNIKVIEILPPAVDTNLNNEGRKNLSEEIKNNMMSLNEYINDVIYKLKNDYIEIGTGTSENLLMQNNDFETKIFKMMNPN